jgi:tetratricopeptide (TPR) repeat protein
MSITKTSIMMCAVSALVVSIASAQEAKVNANSKTQIFSKNSGGQLVSGGDKFAKAHADLVDEGRRAEEKGDFHRAELLYRAATTAFGKDFAATHFPLARLYDKMGQERNAFEEYRIAVNAVDGSSSSLQQDPTVLARYGDLSIRFGTAEEARKAYVEASKHSNRSKTSVSPNTIPRNDSLASLKSAAHTAAAIRYTSTNRLDEATRALAIAIAADRQYWIAHFYQVSDLARRGKNEEAVREAALVEQLAPREEKDRVRALRRDNNIPDLQGREIDPSIRFEFEKKPSPKTGSKVSG